MATWSSVAWLTVVVVSHDSSALARGICTGDIRMGHGAQLRKGTRGAWHGRASR